MSEETEQGWRPGDNIQKMLFERLDLIMKHLMNDPDGRTAYEIMVGLCYQEHPTSMADFVSISKVKKSSVNSNS